MIRIAFYDMDRTITRRATYIPFLIKAAMGGNPLRLFGLAGVAAYTLAYLAGGVDRTRLKEMCQRMLLGPAVAPEAIAPAVRAFARRIKADGCFADALQQIAADRQSGHRLVLATASFRFYTAAIAEELGFDDVVATLSETDARGRIIPKVRGFNCYGPGKLTLVEDWLACAGLARTDCAVRFYSDHISDAPALAWAEEGYAVNPDAAFTRLAQKQGWSVLRWR